MVDGKGLVAQRRLGLLRPLGHRHLKTARLPITSLSHINGASGGIEAPSIAYKTIALPLSYGGKLLIIKELNSERPESNRRRPVKALPRPKLGGQPLPHSLTTKLFLFSSWYCSRRRIGFL